ncbi:hypothetical protein GQ55_3G032000 [Panicum hallii var. hallii]|uniref:Uncharacterized protein n=1 Tax=Panicum hallii var. hallii TaxID=1504633 RepID=A0A2T7E594_9POAL|nr:hypothetical protein GQ55_3G032000 [Panicum hallii var. hallii]
MAAGRVAAGAATLQILLAFVCLLTAASGLYDPPASFARTNHIWYPPAVQVIVIDLGNTNSCVAGYAPGKTETMFQFCIPSWVAFSADGATLVGEAAKNHASAEPDATAFGFKRLLGLRYCARMQIVLEDIVQRAIKRVPYKIGARGSDRPSIQVAMDDGAVKQHDLVNVASMVIAQLKVKAEEYLGRQVRYAIMTVPQHFSEASMQDAENAAKIAGLEIVDMVSEPVAVAVAYDLRRKLRKGGNALVLHVGGGTAFASVVTVLMDGSVGILFYRNDPFLGGDDFDQRIVDYFAKLVKMKHGKDISEDLVALGKLRAACERAKKALSDQDHVQVTVKSLTDGVDFSQPFSRSEFEELNDDTFRRVVALVRRVMLEAERRRINNSIDEILLVGGSTKIPKIQRLIKDYFNRNEPNITLETDEAVALGAVVHTYSSD